MSNVHVLNGKQLSDELLDMQTIQLDARGDIRRPHLVVISIGNNDASNVYVKNKKVACDKCNITLTQLKFSELSDVEAIIQKIENLNKDTTVDGILVQQPVPYKFSGIEQFIANEKDVDGFTTYNLGGTLNNLGYMSACTPNGIIELLHYNDIDIKGKHIVVLGRSNIVGKPLIGLLLNQNATVTSCNSYTENIKDMTRTGDIIISAIGKPKMIDADYLSNRCMCIIDVGMNRDENGKLCGDCDFDNIVACWNLLDDDIDRYITPVPGGVGPMTVYSLVKNVNKAYCNNIIEIMVG